MGGQRKAIHRNSYRIPSLRPEVHSLWCSPVGGLHVQLCPSLVPALVSGEMTPDLGSDLSSKRRMLAAIRGHPRLFVASAWGLSALVFALVRLNTLPPTAFPDSCKRLIESGLAIRSTDWFCVASWATRAAVGPGAVLVFAGFSLPCMVLAATGRRFTALLPFLPAGFMWSLPFEFLSYGSYGWSITWWGINYWSAHPVEAAVLNFILISAPVFAVISVVSKRARPKRSFVLPALLAGGVCLALSTGVLMLAGALISQHFAQIFKDLGAAPGKWTEYMGPVVGPAISIALFGALLGPDRRWWPWSPVVVAFFGSQVPSINMTLVAEHATGSWRWWTVVPLALIGLIWSAWQPGTKVLGPLAFRRKVVLLNAGAIALILIAVISYQADPGPVSLSPHIPARNRAIDLRTKMNLRLAMRAMDSYFAEHGTYEGFDAIRGAKSDGSLVWQDGLVGEPFGLVPHLVMAITSSSSRKAQLVTPGGNGAFCIQHERGHPLTWGTARWRPSPFSSASLLRSLRSARDDCSTRRWTPKTLNPLPPMRCATRESDYLLCRLVEALIGKIMSHTKPEGTAGLASPAAGPTPGASPARAEPASLADGHPVFMVPHPDGSIDFVDAIAYARGGIGHLLSWCSSDRTFGDGSGAAVFDEYGAPISGSARQGLMTYGGILVGQNVELGAPHRPLSRAEGARPGAIGTFCDGRHGVRPEVYGLGTVPGITNLSSNVGHWVVVTGRLVVPHRGPAHIFVGKRADIESVRVSGFGGAKITAAAASRFPQHSTWLGQAVGHGLSGLALFLR